MATGWIDTVVLATEETILTLQPTAIHLETTVRQEIALLREHIEEVATEEEAEVAVASLLEEDIRSAAVAEAPLVALSVEVGVDNTLLCYKGTPYL